MTRALLAILIAMAFASAATALSPGEAGKIVVLIGQLSPEIGEIAFDDEEADQWFEDDAAYEQRITKAGFTRESWKAGFDAVVKGYFALIPQAQIDAMMNAARVQLAQSASLSAEQKAEVAAEFEQHVAKVQRYRDEGRSAADAVRPFAGRLKTLIDSGSED